MYLSEQDTILLMFVYSVTPAFGKLLTRPRHLVLLLVRVYVEL